MTPDLYKMIIKDQSNTIQTAIILNPQYAEPFLRSNEPLMFLSNIEMVSQTNLRVHVLFFSEIKVVSSFPKTTRHNRMKQRLECRMLCDRCKAFISDHLFQELPQDANNYLQNQQGGEYCRPCLRDAFGFHSNLLRGCLGVLG